MNAGEKGLEVAALTLFFVMVFAGLSLATYAPGVDPPTAVSPQTTPTDYYNAGGRIGAYLSHYLYVYLGTLSWFLVGWMGLVSVDLFRKKLRFFTTRSVLGWFLFFLGGAGLLSHYEASAAGVLGTYLLDRLRPLFGNAGALVLFSFSLLLGLTIGSARTLTQTLRDALGMTGSALGRLKQYTGRFPENLFAVPIEAWNWFRFWESSPDDGGTAGSGDSPTINSGSNASQTTDDPDSSPSSRTRPKTDREDEAEPDSSSPGDPDEETVLPFDKKTRGSEDADDRDDTEESANKDPVEVSEDRPEVDEADMSRYRLPPLDLLEAGNLEDSIPSDADLKATAEKLESTFEDFNLDGEVVEVSPGPVLTMYEVEPGPGVSVKKFRSRADDIKLNLAVESVRIVSPIPGKSALGIEVPNQERAVVRLRDVLETGGFQEKSRRLPLGVGMDVLGEPLLVDLASLPHLLVAGATGSGKSVCLNSIICSLLYKLPPDELKFIMIDPKRVELKLYDGLPHLMTPVIDDPSEATKVLKWAVREMENRYETLSEAGVRDIASYNEEVADDPDTDKLPYLVIIVDELADLMLTNPKECEKAVTRLAQMARATGIHMALATQRPSTDVITGLIKANMPARLAFRVSSGTDSRVILDQNGAETLLGNGDLLYLSSDAPHPERGQGSFLSDGETKDLIHFVKKQLKPSYVQKEDLFGSSSGGGNFEETRQDEHYDDAKKLVIERGKASASMIQRRFRVGYNRAARMVDAMEEEGIVGPHRGSKARNVLVDADEYFGEDDEPAADPDDDEAN